MTLILCLRRILVSGCVTPLMKGRTAELLEFSRGAAHLKNMQTSSSGEGMACVGGLENFFLRMLEVISEG